MQSTSVLVLGGQGYVGSALTSFLKAAGVAVRSVDLGLRGGPGRRPNECRSYQSLTADELAEFGSIVLLAGHSSVGACDRAPVEAFDNNVLGFTRLVHLLRGQKLIFASSISVYINTGGRMVTEDCPMPEPVSYYDLHKQMVERYAALAYPNSYAMRFGSISGPSPNIRTELLVNSLVLSAIRNGVIRVANRDFHRPVLGLGDLCRAIGAIISGPVPPGSYNLASTNCRIGDVADEVAARFGADVEEIDSPTRYDIRVDTQKFRQAAGFEFREDVSSLIEALADYYATCPDLGRSLHGL